MEKDTTTTLDLDDPCTLQRLERLHDAAAANVSARLPWMLAWLESHPGWEPWVLGLSGDDGELRAVAPLARRRTGLLLRILCPGHEGLDYCPTVARTTDDAVVLAEAVVGRLQALKRPWALHVRQLPAGSVFGGTLAKHLVAEIKHGADRPVVLLGGGTDRDDHVSRNQRRAEAKARNRMRDAGLDLRQTWITDGAAIAERMPEIRAVHRARDVQLRGASLIDGREGPFYDALIRRHLHRMELLEVRLDNELAAYVLWIRNDGTRLVFDNRVAPRWTHYSAGLIANNEALRTAAADPRITCLDWGAGVQRYKLSSATKVIAHEQLYAWSSQRLRRVGQLRRRIRPG